MFYKFAYTMKAKCHDGVVRCFEHTGFFSSLALLEGWLKVWTGGNYEYFETPEQRLRNLAQKWVKELPRLTIGRFGPQQHEYVYSEYEPAMAYKL